MGLSLSTRGWSRAQADRAEPIAMAALLVVGWLWDQWMISCGMVTCCGLALDVRCDGFAEEMPVDAPIRHGAPEPARGGQGEFGCLPSLWSGWTAASTSVARDDG